ncbi:hypothetical protein Tco_0413448 [Tanacetum coccineum]
MVVKVVRGVDVGALDKEKMCPSQWIFTSPPDRRYTNAVVDWYDLVDSELFSINEYDSLLEDLGFKDGKILFSNFRIPVKSLDEGFASLMSDEDVLSLLWHVPKDREIEEIVEDDDVENKNEASTSKVAPLGEGCGTSEIYHKFDLDLSQGPKEKAKHEMQWDLHTLNDDDDDLLELDDLIDWKQDNYHGDNEKEETALLFVELDQLLEHVAFLNVELRESVVGVDLPVIDVDAPIVPVDAPDIALKKEIQIPRKRKRYMEYESSSAIVTFGRANKRRMLYPTDKTEKIIKYKSMEANGLGFHV